ncbi:MAG: ATP-binding protein [Mycobacteriales bacterium]
MEGVRAPAGAVWPAEPLRIEPVAQGAGVARRYVRRALVEAGLESYLDQAAIAVSELVTNACLHARTPIVVRVGPGERAPVRITVTDFSTVRPRARRPGALSAVGRGLHLLGAAGSWGVQEERPGPGKSVWFEPHPSWDA